MPCLSCVCVCVCVGGSESSESSSSVLRSHVASVLGVSAYDRQEIQFMTDRSFSLWQTGISVYGRQTFQFMSDRSFILWQTGVSIYGRQSEVPRSLGVSDTLKYGLSVPRRAQFHTSVEPPPGHKDGRGF